MYTTTFTTTRQSPFYHLDDVHSFQGKFSDGRFVTKDGPIDDWRGKLKRHEKAQSLLIRQDWKHDVAQIYGHRKAGAGVSTIHWYADGGYFPGYANMIPYSQSAEEAAFYELLKKEFLGKSEEELFGFTEVVFLAELKKTLNLIAHPLDGILKLLRGLLRNLKNTENLAHAGALFLEFKFGVKPLMSDIDKAMQTLAEKLGHEQIKMIRHGDKVTSARCDIDSTPIYNYGSPLQAVKVGTISSIYSETFVEFRALMSSSVVKHYYDARPGAIERQFLDEVKSSIWELVKFSWLADYFFDIQTEINARRKVAAQLSYHFVRVKRTTRVSYRLYCDNVTAPMTNVIPVDGTGTVEFTEKRRIQISDADSLAKISFDTQLSSNQKMNITALLAQRVFSK